MAKITIGTGLWSDIKGYLNSMFTEIYASMAGNDVKETNATHTGDVTGATGLTIAATYKTARYTGTHTATGNGTVTTKTTTATALPYSILMYDATGMPLTNDMIQKCEIVGGFLVLTFYNGGDDDVICTINVLY